MIKIDNLPTLKQYNLDGNKMSNLIKESIAKSPTKSLNIIQLLQNLNLETNQQNKAIALELLKLNLPLKEAFFSEITNFLDKFGASDTTSLEDKIKVAILLKELKLPLNKNFFKLFKNHFNSNQDIKENLAQLLELTEGAKGEKNIKAILEELIQKSSSKTANSQENTSKEMTTKINNLIKDLNLADNTKNRQIIKELIKFKLPLNQETINNIKNTLAKLDLPSDTQAEKVKLKASLVIEKFKLPLKEAKQLLAKINLKPQDNLATTITKLVKAITTTSSTENLSKLILPKLKEIINSNPKLLIQLKEDLPSAKFKELSNKLKLGSEAEILKKEINQELKEAIITPDKLNSQAIKNSISNLNFEQSKENKLMKFLFNLNSPDSTDELTKESQKLLQQLTTTNAMNYESNLTTLFLPFAMGENLNLAKLIINKEGNNSEESDEEELNFAFATSTKKLGNVEIKVKIKDKRANILFLSNNSKTVRLINHHLDNFKEKLKENKYQINFLSCKLREEDLKTGKKEELKLTSVDFTI